MKLSFRRYTWSAGIRNELLSLSLSPSFVTRPSFFDLLFGLILFRCLYRGRTRIFDQFEIGIFLSNSTARAAHSGLGKGGISIRFDSQSVEFSPGTWSGDVLKKPCGQKTSNEFPYLDNSSSSHAFTFFLLLTRF